MIGRLTGKILHCAPDRALLDVAGVGYDVQIPLSTFYALSSGKGATVSLHVHTHVREDALLLFGFAEVAERAAFEQLIAISGVGPRMALAILSGIGVEDLHRTVARQDRERLQKIPGVGKKTAERLLLELRDRFAGEPEPAAGTGSSPPAGGAEHHAVLADAVSALVNLGYSRQVSERAVDRAASADADEETLESLLRNALAGLVR